MKRLSVSVLLVLMAAACNQNKKITTDEIRPTPSVPPESARGMITVSYKESTNDFNNPERGFYRYSETKTSNYSLLEESHLVGYTKPHKPSSATFQILSTLVFRYFVIDDTKAGPLREETLQNFQKDMDVARAAGVKVIPRFVYTTKSVKGDCPEGFICPPYGDAPKEIVLQHIGQLKPFFHKNEDVIAAVQLGLIGTWGENYYTDYFGDPSGNGGQGEKLSNKNWEDRSDVLRALLDAVPASRMVQVRYPQFKQRFLYGADAPYTTPGMKEEDAFSGRDIARIGIHNDCFLSSSNDVGTYEDYGNSATPRSSSPAVVTGLRQYAMNEGKYTVVGGETCNDAFSPNNDCEPAGRAQEEMAVMRYSYLNADYNPEVNNDWKNGGCIENIKKNLGYRFVLEHAQFSEEVKPGGILNVKFILVNRGYASPFNERPAVLVLRSVADGSIVRLVMKTDVRKWFSGSITVEEEFTLPQNLARGKYELLLALPDASESISKRPEYAVRLANEGVWEEATGMNKLNYQLQIN